MNLDQEIDKLYQLPLEEFTPARNALAKNAGSSAVKVLQKPSAPAWAVNQLYWQSRPIYDALIKAAEHLRDAHRSLLGGKTVDIHRVEAEHRDKLRSAVQEVRRIIVDADGSPSEQTMMAVNETLEALPAGDEQPGRLTRPLKRLGFEALAGAPPRPPGVPPAKLTLVKSGSKKAAAEPEIAPAVKREIEEIEKRLNGAAVEERQAKADLERARRELERAERDQSRAEEELKEATAKAKRFQEQVAEREKALRALTAEQEKLEKRLAKLR
jgi:DNA repair exonuclease SbcCD ATPase subunit